MARLLRVMSCDYSVYNRTLVMQVEDIDTEDKDNNSVYLVVAPVREVPTPDALRSFVENEVNLQKKVHIPNYSGLEWSVKSIS